MHDLVFNEDITFKYSGKKPLYYNVNPRYTPGSPAMVSKSIAEHVAQQEREGYERALTGVMGEEDKAKAETAGLRGVVEGVLAEKKWRVLTEGKWQAQAGFVILDLCTKEVYWRPLH